MSAPQPPRGFKLIEQIPERDAPTPPPGFELFDPQQEEPPKDQGLFSQFLHGALKTTTAVTNPLDPVLGIIKQRTGLTRGKTRTEQLTGAIEKVLPEQEGFVPGAVRKSGEILPMLIGQGGGMLSQVLRAGAAGLSSQTAKELGAGPFGQFMAELPALSFPRSEEHTSELQSH